jgi:hypothetical protein
MMLHLSMHETNVNFAANLLVSDIILPEKKWNILEYPHPSNLFEFFK